VAVQLKEVQQQATTTRATSHRAVDHLAAKPVMHLFTTKRRSTQDMTVTSTVIPVLTVTCNVTLTPLTLIIDYCCAACGDEIVGQAIGGKHSLVYSCD
jgi:predicted RNA-binding Zn-ribbon protein involved in translation (DUF1610 family)